MGDWLLQKATAAKVPVDLLETVGLVAKRESGRGGYYDRFRDRVMFPIRDVRGQTVGFGGRILPGSPYADRAPKYYNSSETPLFSKSEQLYGIDHARPSATKLGYLAVVEGYTDVMMAHQCGVANVVATMGTALTGRHVKKLRGFVKRVVLVYDADAGGDTGVDRALEVFVTNELDLRIAGLSDGLDPCDLLVAQGPDPFRAALEGAVDVFEYKLLRVWDRHAATGVEGRRQAAEEVLTILAAAPEDQSVKVEMMVNRLAGRLSIKEATLWARFRELRAKRKGSEPEAPQPGPAPPARGRRAKAARHEVELLELLLADPPLVGQARAEIAAEEVEHPGLRQLLTALYALSAEGGQPDLDHLPGRVDNEELLDTARKLQDQGLDHHDRPAYLKQVIVRFRERREARRTQEIRAQVLAADDPAAAIELLRKLNERATNDDGTEKRANP
jgi:DNA primase